MNEIIKLSRSTVEKYLSCPRCCVLDKKYKIKPPSLPFTLNIARFYVGFTWVLRGTFSTSL